MEPYITPGTNQYELFQPRDIQGPNTIQEISRFFLRTAQEEGLEVLTTQIPWKKPEHTASWEYLRNLREFDRKSRENAKTVMIGTLF